MVSQKDEPAKNQKSSKPGKKAVTKKTPVAQIKDSTKPVAAKQKK